MKNGNPPKIFHPSKLYSLTTYTSSTLNYPTMLTLFATLAMLANYRITGRRRRLSSTTRASSAGSRGGAGGQRCGLGVEGFD